MANIRRALHLPTTSSDEEVAAAFNDRITHLKNEINNFQENKNLLVNYIKSMCSEINYLCSLMPRKTDNPRWFHVYICRALNLKDDVSSDTIDTTYNTKIEELNKYKDDLTSKLLNIQKTILNNQNEIRYLKSLQNDNSDLDYRDSVVPVKSYNSRLYPMFNGVFDNFKFLKFDSSNTNPNVYSHFEQTETVNGVTKFQSWTNNYGKVSKKSYTQDHTGKMITHE